MGARNALEPGEEGCLKALMFKQDRQQGWIFMRKLSVRSVEPLSCYDQKLGFILRLNITVVPLNLSNCPTKKTFSVLAIW